ncbi:MAG: hypothetical protein HDQ88_03810 [Clostridia bacterium]|nr:hypothetical protein [Clostridia bacterium]
MWGDFADSKTVSSNLGYVEEGNVKKFKFTEQPQRVRFLTEDIDVEQVMSEQKMSREEAVDYINRNIGTKKWLAPKSFWEHSIKSIPQVRFFSTVYCTGKMKCPLCGENDKARESGVSENKLLPFPVRRRFICPVYVYDLKMVLYLVAAEDFFQDVSRYVAKNGSDIDFEVSKSGKGFDTKYNGFFLGKSAEELPKLNILSPEEIDLYCGDEELKRRVGTAPTVTVAPSQFESHNTANMTTPPQNTPTTEPQGAFVLPFGTHKGKTFEEVEQVAGLDYIKFLAENSSGTVQTEAEKYIRSKS